MLTTIVIIPQVEQRHVIAMNVFNRQWTLVALLTEVQHHVVLALHQVWVARVQGVKHLHDISSCVWCVYVTVGDW